MHNSIKRLSLLAAAVTMARGAVLTFDGDICSTASDGSGASAVCLNGSWINQTYGDSADVDISYAAGGGPTSLQRWDTGYSNLTNIAYGFFGAGTASITLTPLGGRTVTLNSFNLGTNPANVSRDAEVTVVDLATNTIVFSQSLTGANQVAAIASLVSPGVASQTGLRVTYSGNVFDLGIDNVDFTLTDPSQGGGGGTSPVPEPSAALLVPFGIAGIAALRRFQPGIR